MRNNRVGKNVRTSLTYREGGGGGGMPIQTQAMQTRENYYTCRQEASAWRERLSRGGRRKDDQQGDEHLRRHKALHEDAPSGSSSRARMITQMSAGCHNVHALTPLSMLAPSAHGRHTRKAQCAR